MKNYADFRQEADEVLAHATEAERDQWAQQCCEQHPGRTQHHITEAGKPVAKSYWGQPSWYHKLSYRVANAMPWAQAAPWLMLWRLAVLALLCIMALRAEDAKPPANPSIEEKSQVQTLQLQAYQLVAKIKSDRPQNQRRQQQ